MRPGPRRNVFVALHGRPSSERALQMGRLVADALSAPLHGLFVWSAPIPPHDVARMCQLPERALHGVVLDVAVGDAAERLVELAQAQPTSLFVVSAPDAQVDPLGLGSSAARALAGSPAAIIVVRENMRIPDRLSHILVPLDGTPSTANSIGPAAELACQAGAAIDIVHVGASGHRSIPPEDAEPGSMHTPRYVDQPQHEWPAFSEEFLDRFLGAIAHCPADVPTRMYLGAGQPAAEILRFASELSSDLIVLVWHGDLDAQHGEVFEQVMRAAPCPVLVLKR
jgi:nucleotide-binding universal stress UspA family protein